MRLYTHVSTTENIALYGRLGFRDTARERVYMAKATARGSRASPRTEAARRIGIAESCIRRSSSNAPPDQWSPAARPARVRSTGVG